MSFKETSVEELDASLKLVSSFTVWLGWLVVPMKLVLAEYQIGFQGLTATLIGAPVLSEVVLILEHVPFGEWMERLPARVDVR
jgi:hypothetical protein